MATPAIKGFRWAGMACGIKSKPKKGVAKKDLALWVADRPVNTAAVFTRNIVSAAPVQLAKKRVRSGKCQAVLVNSGNANACTGKAGMRATEKSSAAVAAALGIAESKLLPASTGVIGQVLPYERIVAVAPELVSRLSPKGIDDFSQAILTTDSGPKVVSTTFKAFGERMRVTCIAKGAGMIHPDMATTLAFLATDADVDRAVIRRALRRGTELTFNRATVDGDTSTNDTIVSMASAARGKRISTGSRAEKLYAAAVTEVLEGAAKMLVADGEGSEHLVRIDVTGAPSELAATRVARTIAQSMLVKTAVFGKDPNWGRILAAAGRSGVKFTPERVAIYVGDVPIVRAGQPLGAAAEAKAHRIMKRAEYSIRVHLAAGKGRSHYWACDLGHGYVTVNADYRT